MRVVEETWLAREAQRSLQRLLPRLEQEFATQAQENPANWQTFIERLEANFAQLFRPLVQLYGEQYDFFYHLERLLTMAARMWWARSAELKALDAAREANPRWFQSQEMLGGVCYVDLFAGNLQGLREKLPYFKELGLTYLHLMPAFLTPEGESDGGYAVSSYRALRPDLGTMDEMVQLAAELRENGISLVLDFVFNHTSDEHEWTKRALAGDPEYQAYYRMFPDREMPDAYEVHLREIFPDEHPGAFTYRPKIKQWVWTTFHPYQWDLNYANPVVFRRMAEEMLFLANVGVEILRLDAIAFTWKALGTNSENLPEAHLLVQAFNALVRIAAPALLFKSEAIVHPDEVVKYIAPDECQLSYNPLLMAMLWNSLATREVQLLNETLRTRFALKPECAWVNYVRSHDDIGWTFSDEDAARLGINGYDHRQFLNAFYSGRFPGSFARGLLFQENQKTGDARVAGTCASLAGLEKALREETEVEVELAIRRILLLHSIILTAGGIPLIYFGDELGFLNDYSFRADPDKTRDNRWVHRPIWDWERAEQRYDEQTLAGRIHQELCRLIKLRAKQPALANGVLEVMDTGNDHVLGYMRVCDGLRLLILANFTEAEQVVAANRVRLNGLGYTFTELVRNETIALEEELRLQPYQFVWLQA